MIERDEDDIITFHQGVPDELGVQAYSFRIATESKEIEGKTIQLPKKLGDGNFGMVFEAPSTTSGVGTFALKVLYLYRANKAQSNGDTSDSSFLEELHIGRKLPELLKDIVAEISNSKEAKDQDFPIEGDRQSQWLVLPKAYSENFTDFVGRDVLEQQDIKFSKYAYIMEKFDHSLKDLMEEPIIEEEGGYGRLRISTLRERECSSLPILDQMARGLQVLHAAGLRHQDIKPANIYVKKIGTQVVLRLGDLGFLRPHDPTRSGTAVASIDTVGIGTKHYRSIEQIDFTDVAECDVEVDKSGLGATLNTRDPKFLGTIMRTGDLAYFAKSNSHRLFRIDELKKNFDKGSIEIRVSQQVAPGKDEKSGRMEENPLVADRKTQVAFFKNAGTKTDLFGLGCILYDILTMGDSPERFYELLRRFDKNDTDVQQRILDLYTTWLVGTLEDADVGAIFSRVNRGNDRAQPVHIDILGFLLKCMMSDAKGSYYDICGFGAAELTGERKNDRDAKVAAMGSWTKVIREVKRISEVLGAGSYEEYNVNVLTRDLSRTMSGDIESSTHSVSRELSDDLQTSLSIVLRAYLSGESPFQLMDELSNSKKEISEVVVAPTNVVGNSSDSKTNLESTDKLCAYRWLMSGLLIKKITDWIDISVGKSNSALRSLSQEHVSVKGHSIVAWRRVVSGSEKDIVRSLRARDPLLTRIRLFASRFEPIWWSYGTRRIRLSYDGNGTGNSGEFEGIEYEFMDFAFVSVPVDKDDFVLASDGTSSVVFRVVTVSEDNVLSLRICTDEEGDIRDKDPKKLKKDRQDMRNVLNSVENTYFIKNSNAINYYAGMLSMYLYHFLVWGGVGQDQRILDFPAEVYAGIRNYPVRFKSCPSARAGVRKSRNGGITWDIFRDQTLELIMWLGLGGFAYDEVGNKNDTDSERWRFAKEEVDSWYNGLNDFGLKRGKTDNWNLLTTTIDSDDVKDFMKSDFKSISRENWERICGQYIGDSIFKDKEMSEQSYTDKPFWRKMFG